MEAGRPSLQSLSLLHIVHRCSLSAAELDAKWFSLLIHYYPTYPVIHCLILVNMRKTYRCRECSFQLCSRSQDGPQVCSQRTSALLSWFHWWSSYPNKLNIYLFLFSHCLNKRNNSILIHIITVYLTNCHTDSYSSVKKSLTYPEGKQWAAVRTQHGAMRVPPHTNLGPVKIAAIQGWDSTLVLNPPIIFVIRGKFRSPHVNSA